jgi:hypothetical protein
MLILSAESACGKKLLTIILSTVLMLSAESACGKRLQILYLEC